MPPAEVLLPPETLIEGLAREVLRGYFNDPDGFKNMQRGPRAAAVKRLADYIHSLTGESRTCFGQDNVSR